jgi:hypothetical protein
MYYLIKKLKKIDEFLWRDGTTVMTDVNNIKIM